MEELLVAVPLVMRVELLCNVLYHNCSPCVYTLQRAQSTHVHASQLPWDQRVFGWGHIGDIQG